MEREANKLKETLRKTVLELEQGRRSLNSSIRHLLDGHFQDLFSLTLKKAYHSKIIKFTRWAFPCQTLHKLHRFQYTLHSHTDSWSCRICYYSHFTVIGQLSKCKLPSRRANCYNTIRYKVVFCVRAQEFIREHKGETLSARVRSLHRTIF